MLLRSTSYLCELPPSQQLEALLIGRSYIFNLSNMNGHSNLESASCR